MVGKESLATFEDENLDKIKQDIIKTFKQDHLIKAYSKLDSAKRQHLLTQMEAIHFDLIDLVDSRMTKVYHNKIKTFDDWFLRMRAANIPSEFLLNPPDYTSKDMFNKGLDQIAAGKVAIMLFAGYFSNVATPPRPLFKPKWGNGLSLLEYFIRKIKNLGEYGRCLTYLQLSLIRVRSSERPESL